MGRFKENVFINRAVKVTNTENTITNGSAVFDMGTHLFGRVYFSVSFWSAVNQATVHGVTSRPCWYQSLMHFVFCSCSMLEQQRVFNSSCVKTTNSIGRCPNTAPYAPVMGHGITN